MNHDALVPALVARGFAIVSQSNRKNTLLAHPELTYPVYVVNNSSSTGLNLVVHPDHDGRLDALRRWPSVFDGTRATGYSKAGYPLSFKSGFRAFPKDEPIRTSPEPYGIGMRVLNTDVLDHVVAVLRSAVPSLMGAFAPPSVLEDVAAAEAELAMLGPSERDAVTKARIGQGPFREDLIRYWGRCAVTGIDDLRLLRASHIHPWRLADNAGRRDPFNGLLLSPSLDHCFDRGLIGFADDGRIVARDASVFALVAPLGIGPFARLTRVDARHCPNLAAHRALFDLPDTP
jgi:putative restriction endonuclease